MGQIVATPCWLRVRCSPLANFSKTTRSSGSTSFLSIEELPIGILSIIMEFLPQSSAAAFCLSTQALYDSLGRDRLCNFRLPTASTQDPVSALPTKHLVQRDENIERSAFLSTLQKDLPGWQFCYHCVVLHPIDEDIGYNDSVRLEDSAACPRSSQNVWRDGGVETEIIAHIRDDGLSVRTVSILKLGSFCSDNSLALQKLPHACPHFEDSWSYPFWNMNLARILSCRIKHAKAASQACYMCSKTIRCRRCKTWIVLSVSKDEHDDELYLEFEVNRWLGYCGNPLDDDWRRQCYELESDDPTVWYVISSTQDCDP